VGSTCLGPQKSHLRATALWTEEGEKSMRMSNVYLSRQDCLALSQVFANLAEVIK
jgi:hypothetical protein